MGQCSSAQVGPESAEALRERQWANCQMLLNTLSRVFGSNAQFLSQDIQEIARTLTQPQLDELARAPNNEVVLAFLQRHGLIDQQHQCLTLAGRQIALRIVRSRQTGAPVQTGIPVPPGTQVGWPDCAPPAAPQPRGGSLQKIKIKSYVSNTKYIRIIDLSKR